MLIKWALSSIDFSLGPLFLNSLCGPKYSIFRVSIQTQIQFIVFFMWCAFLWGLIVWMMQICYSTAGGTPTQGTSPTTTTTNNPNMPTTPSSTTPLVDNGGSNGMIPGMTPPISTTDNSEASSKLPAISILMHISFGLLLSSIFPYI